MQSGTIQLPIETILLDFQNLIKHSPSTVCHVWDNNPQLQSWFKGETVNAQALSDSNLLYNFRLIVSMILSLQRYCNDALNYGYIMKSMWTRNTRLHAAVENNNNAKLILEEILKVCIILKCSINTFLESIKSQDLIKSLVPDIKNDNIRLSNQQNRQFNKYLEEYKVPPEKLISFHAAEKRKTLPTKEVKASPAKKRKISPIVFDDNGDDSYLRSLYFLLNLNNNKPDEKSSQLDLLSNEEINRLDSPTDCLDSLSK